MTRKEQPLKEMAAAAMSSVMIWWMTVYWSGVENLRRPNCCSSSCPNCCYGSCPRFGLIDCVVEVIRHIEACFEQYLLKE